MIAFENANIVLKDSIMYDAALLADGGRISEFGPQGEVAIPQGAQRIDCADDYLVPGLIDIHTHAGGGVWFYEDPAEAAGFHLRHGTTSLLPTMYVNMDADEQIQGVKSIEAASRSGPGRIIKGLYMEGTYLNPKYGCDISGNKWASRIDRRVYGGLLEASAHLAKIWCIAPERDGMDSFVDDVRAAIPGIIFSVAHSEAMPAQVERLIGKGLRLATHYTNATGASVKLDECRSVSVDDSVCYNDEIFAELICDSRGIHVDPYVLRLTVKIKGRDRIILVSDACAFDGPIPEKYEGVSDICFDHEGAIAGSKLTLDQACRNIMKHTGCGICDAVRYASLNPARLLGMAGYGCIEKDNIADLLVVDHRMNVKKVVLGGVLQEFA